MKKAVKRLPAFNPHFYYMNSVQAPDHDAQFLHKVAKRRLDKALSSVTLREDFCGTFALCCEWIKLSRRHKAIGIDLDPAPIAYGKRFIEPMLSGEQASRLQVLQNDVAAPSVPPADIICAFNFSYFGFKTREQLKHYFARCLATLPPGGLLALDCFGGPTYMTLDTEERNYPDLMFKYFWELAKFDAFSSEALFYIHFQRRGEEKRKRVFTYDWRLWSPAEIKDLLIEVGFKDVEFFAEGLNRKGEGDGDFKKVKTGDPCDGWVCYIVSQK